MVAHRLMGHVSFWRGDFCGSRHNDEEAIRLYEPWQYGEREYYCSFVHGQVPALSTLSAALCILGYPEQALPRCREAVALARELSHPFSEASALNTAGFIYLQLSEWKSCRETAEAMIALANEHGFVDYMGSGTFYQADALMGLGELDLHEGIAVMRAVIDAARAMGFVAASQLLLSRMVERYGEAGQVEEGLALVAEALEVMGNTGVRVFEAEISRLKGELILARPSSDHEEAEACFRKALDVARSQSAKFWELRAAMSLARLWQDQGRKDEARELLAPVYGWFTEGFNTQDLKEAKALLDELA
jgi:predicted ATPase